MLSRPLGLGRGAEGEGRAQLTFLASSSLSFSLAASLLPYPQYNEIIFTGEKLGAGSFGVVLKVSSKTFETITQKAATSDNVKLTVLAPPPRTSSLKGTYLGIEVAVKEVLPSKDYEVSKYFEREWRIMKQVLLLPSCPLLVVSSS